MLEIRGLSHHFGQRRVLDDVSFTVGDGYLTGFVGANGAGKTTTMRAILGLITPTSGEILVNGAPITAADRSRIGYMPEERGLYPKMKVREQIVYFARLHGIDAAAAGRSADRLLERLGIEERANDEVLSLSLGNQQRAQICVALAHDPDVLILDEPFSGLDPVAVDAVLGVLQEFAAKGTPVLFSSHQLDVVERLSNELVIIADGEIRAAGDRRELQEQHSRGRYRIRLADDSWLQDRPGMEILERGESGVILRFTGEGDGDDVGSRAQAILREALDRGPVLAFDRDLVRLVTIFREVR